MLSSTAEYALRALIVMAGLPDGEPVSGAALSAETQVPSNYLSKILHALRKAGLVSATRGKGGGYRLGRHPKRIRLAEVVEVFDGNWNHRGCLLGKALRCTDDNPCSIHGRWQEVHRTVTDFLESTTLSDAASSPEVLGLGGPFSKTGRKNVRGMATTAPSPKRGRRTVCKRG